MEILRKTKRNLRIICDITMLSPWSRHRSVGIAADWTPGFESRRGKRIFLVHSMQTTVGPT
jgi:hypothetical protein